VASDQDLCRWVARMCGVHRLLCRLWAKVVPIVCARRSAGPRHGTEWTQPTVHLSATPLVCLVHPVFAVYFDCSNQGSQTAGSAFVVVFDGLRGATDSVRSRGLYPVPVALRPMSTLPHPGVRTRLFGASVLSRPAVPLPGAHLPTLL